jgi:hypothetical protein
MDVIDDAAPSRNANAHITYHGLDGTHGETIGDDNPACVCETTQLGRNDAIGGQH